MLNACSDGDVKLSRLLLVPVLFAVTACASTSITASAPAARDTPSVSVDRVVAQDLTSPWGMTFAPDGAAYVSERDTGLIKRVDPKKPAGKNVSVVGKVPGVVPNGEGGLLGIALTPNGSELFAYYSAKNDNRVARIPVRNNTLGKPVVILKGIPMNTYHNGGRILLDNDGSLFVATGDAGDTGLSQRSNTLAGKVLHIDRNGKAVDGSRIFTTGHRNVQGLAFDIAGGLWASEFGAKDADELNYLTAGGNYGWPIYEGKSKDDRYENPKAQWTPTSLASPSGIAIKDDNAYVASLRGEVLWQVPLTQVTSENPRARTPVALQLGDLGRLRTIEVAPDGSLWLVTSNTDGRGDPRRTDDQVIRLVVK